MTSADGSSVAPASFDFAQDKPGLLSQVRLVLGAADYNELHV